MMLQSSSPHVFQRIYVMNNLQIAQPCTKMLLYCEWQRAPVNCSKIFQQVPSSQVISF